MMVVGFRSIPIAKLRLPGDWKKKLDDPGVPAMAESEKMVGIIHEPLIRERDFKLLAGHRRVAACVFNGKEEVLCKVVDCTDEEGELIRLFENGYREHMTPEQRAVVVDQLAERIALLRSEGKQTIQEPRRKKGKLKLPRTVARELVAQATGRTKEAERKAEQRFRKKQDAIADATDHNADLGINSPWADLDDDFRRQTNQVVKRTHEIAVLFTRALGMLTQLVESGLPVHQARLNRMKEDVALLSKTMRGLIPSDLCPYCKGIEELQKKCGGCAGAGYVTTNQREGIPKELWEVGDKAVVMTNGKMLPFDSFFAKEPETDLTMVTDDPFAGVGE